MKTTKGKLRNITTGILHTKMEDVYRFIDDYTGMPGIMTHNIPSACKALEPILRTKLSNIWFTDLWLKENLDEPIELPDLTPEEKELYLSAFRKYSSEVWDMIKDKTIIIKK